MIFPNDDTAYISPYPTIPQQHSIYNHTIINTLIYSILVFPKNGNLNSNCIYIKNFVLVIPKLILLIVFNIVNELEFLYIL